MDGFLLFPTSLLCGSDPKAGMYRILAYAARRMAEGTETWLADKRDGDRERTTEAVLLRIGCEDTEADLWGEEVSDLVSWGAALRKLGFAPHTESEQEWGRLIGRLQATAEEAGLQVECMAEEHGNAQMVRLSASVFCAAWSGIYQGKDRKAWTWNRLRMYCAILARCAGHKVPWRITRPELQAVASGQIYRAVKAGKAAPDDYWTDKRVRDALEWLHDGGFITRLIVSPRVTKYMVGRHSITKLDDMEQRIRQSRSQRDAAKARELQARRRAEQEARAAERAHRIASKILDSLDDAEAQSLFRLHEQAELKRREREAKIRSEVLQLQGIFQTRNRATSDPE